MVAPKEGMGGSTPSPDPTVLTREATKQAKDAADKVDKIRDKAFHRELKLRQQQRHTEITAIRREMNIEFTSMRRELKTFGKFIDALSAAETKRIDATRTVDVAAAASDKVTAEIRATTLAGQVSAAKDAQAISMKAETDPLRKDIGDLRQSQWTIAGGTDQSRESKSDSRGRSANWGLWVGIAIAAFVGISGLMMTGFGILVTYLITRPR
jgi:hypothetical protein